MVQPPPERFAELAAKRTIVPVWRDVLCDGDTPVGAYAKLRGLDPTCFLLESVVGGQRWARYSFIGVGHRARVVGPWKDGHAGIEITPGPGFGSPAPVQASDALGAVEELLARYASPPIPELPRFWGGLVGVWGHDLVREIESLPAPAWPSDPELPVFDLLLTDTLVIFDNLSLKVRVVATAVPEEDGGVEAAYARAQARIDRVAAALAGPGKLGRLELEEGVEPRAMLAEPWRTDGARPYPEQVVAAKRYVAEGDVFQLVLSQRFDEPIDGLDPFDVYRTLRVTNPAPYMYLLELPSATLAGASPEVLVRVDIEPDEGGEVVASRKVTVRPIAGTRPRGRDEEEDQRHEADLLADPKERAEHLMLIDLGRNDVGRVSEPGSVRMEEAFVIERYSRVMHIVSEVSGTLRAGDSALDALRATFPAGTLSGAPKVRALELIDELEPAPRGWYGGAVGYLGFDGAADFAICIRSVVFCEGRLRIQAGAGLVYDSVPASEDEECHRKALAVTAAVAMARAGRPASSAEEEPA